jgi:superfamily I DNA and/or RNA helicase
MNLLGQSVIGRGGLERPMTLDDALIVAPYDIQVNLLRSILPGARVGTVDKFRGQEAVTILMTTSGADDMLRDASFLLSHNRLNVAISLARCLAVLGVAGPS